MSDENHADNEEAMVRCGTTQGDVAIHLRRAWSPHGYDRALDLFDKKFMDGSHFFRVVPHFLVQFGLTYSTDPELRKLQHSTIPDDPQLEPRIPFEPGTVSFAGGGTNSRSSQLFISYGSAASLGTQLWETPVGKVVEGMEHIENLYAEYGDMPPWGHGPEQPLIRSEGLPYMQQNFPEMDRFQTCTVEILNQVAQEAQVVPMNNKVRRQQAVNVEGNVDIRGTHKVGAGSGEEQDALPTAAIVVGVVLCGAVFLFFVRIIRLASKPSTKVS